MKKIISLVLSLLWMGAALVGCGLGAAPETEAPTEPPVEEVAFETVPDGRKYLGVQLQLFSLLAQEDPEAAAITQAAEVFAGQTGAQVTVTWFGGDEGALIQSLAEGQTADVFEISGAALQSDGLNYALDLTELARNADYDSKSFPCLRQQVVDRCGCLAGIPSVPSLTGVYYNREVFGACGIDNVPETWEEFLTVCRQLTACGYAPLAMDAENACIPLELHLERNLGAAQLAALLSEGGWKDDEQAENAAQQIVEFAAAGFLAKDCPADYPAGQNKLALSNAVMAAGSNALCGQVEQTNLAEIAWGVFAWPGDGAGTGTAVDADVMAVHKNSANAQAAFDFVMLLTTGEFDQLRADLGGGIPADPANQSVIAGAVETLAAASARSLGLLDPKDNGVFVKLWQGKYKKGANLLSALESLE